MIKKGTPVYRAHRVKEMPPRAVHDPEDPPIPPSAFRRRKRGTMAAEAHPIHGIVLLPAEVYNAYQDAVTRHRASSANPVLKRKAFELHYECFYARKLLDEEG